MNDSNVSSIVEVTTDKIIGVIKLLSPYSGYASTAYELLQSIFGGSDTGLSTDELYRNITKLVKDENKRQAIQLNLAHVKAAINFLKIDYANSKDDLSYTISQKEADLKSNNLRLKQAIDFFMLKEVSEQAINEFILAANIALMYYKELAEIHKGNNVNYETGYKNYKINLSAYISHAQSTAANILNKRQSQITQVKRNVSVINGSDCVFYSFTDRFTNTVYSKDNSLNDEATKKESERAREDLLKSLEDSMNPIILVINAWKNLNRLGYMNIIETEAFGDPTTNMFDDFNKIDRIKKLSISYGCVIDGITVHYNDFTVHHGGYVSNPVEVNLENGDYIVEVYGYYEPWEHQNGISLLKFKTKNGKTYGPYGRRPYDDRTYDPIDPNHEFVLKGNLNQEICAFFGSKSFDDRFLSRLGCYYKIS